MKKTLTAIALLIALTGCAATGVNVTDAQTSQLIPGETTKEQVIAAFGSPTTQMRQSDGTTTLMYTYAEAKTRAATFIPIVGIFAGGMDTRSNTVSINFDANGKLIDHTSMSSEYGTGTGAAAGQIEPVLNQPRK